MNRFGAILALIMAAVIWGVSSASAVDFPPEILFDQYLLEAKRALEDTTRSNRKINRRKAAEAFKRIEGLNLDLSLEFRFFYGKFLASADPSESLHLAKGMSLLKQYVLEAGRNAEHYADALELLSTDKMKGALMTACFHGHTEAVKILLGEGVNDLGPREVYIGDDRFLYSPIDVAARNGHAEIVKLLLAAGSKIQGSFGVAVRYGQAEVVRVLMDKVPETYNWTRRLTTAVDYDHVEVVKILIAAGADPNVKDEHGNTLLHNADLHGARNAKVIKVLIAAGADPNVKNEYGNTPLHDAVRYINRTYLIKHDNVKALIAGGADPNVLDQNGKTPLYRAFRRAVTREQYIIYLGYRHRGGKREECDGDFFQGVIRDLIAGGADPNPKDPSGVTLLHDIVGEHVALECTKFLLDLGADPNVKDNDGNTPLHHLVMEASEINFLEMSVRILVAAGADLNVKNNDGKRPRRLAIERAKSRRYYKFIARILKDAGAKR